MATGLQYATGNPAGGSVLGLRLHQSSGQIQSQDDAPAGGYEKAVGWTEDVPQVGECLQPWLGQL